MQTRVVCTTPATENTINVPSVSPQFIDHKITPHQKNYTDSIHGSKDTKQYDLRVVLQHRNGPKHSRSATVVLEEPWRGE